MSACLLLTLSHDTGPTDIAWNRFQGKPLVHLEKAHRSIEFRTEGDPHGPWDRFQVFLEPVNFLSKLKPVSRNSSCYLIAFIVELNCCTEVK